MCRSERPARQTRNHLIFNVSLRCDGLQTYEPPGRLCRPQACNPQSQGGEGKGGREGRPLKVPSAARGPQTLAESVGAASGAAVGRLSGAPLMVGVDACAALRNLVGVDRAIGSRLGYPGQKGSSIRWLPSGGEGGSVTGPRYSSANVECRASRLANWNRRPPMSRIWPR